MLCEEQKDKLFHAVKNANYGWVLLSLLFGFLSHLSRAWRSKFLLEPLGYKTHYPTLVHALFVGYIVNLAFPRAGEASRAGLLQSKLKVPFQKGFGTIVAERAIDLGMLALVFLIALFLQFDDIEILQEKIKLAGEAESDCGKTNYISIMGTGIKWLIILGVGAAIVGMSLSKNLRLKAWEFVKGVWEGATVVFKSDKKLWFIAHTLFIWIMYVSMFSVCFYSMESTAVLGADAMLAGFIAGTIGMIVVQGGLGVYPALVAVVVGFYLPGDGSEAISSEGLALGWIIWTSQTIMMIVLGLISLSYFALKTKEGE
jgi:uncharacterized membrane protein YbhN (UPF0104 family)